MVCVTVIVAGAVPQLNVTTPPAVSAVASAASVHEAAVPLPTTFAGALALAGMTGGVQIAAGGVRPASLSMGSAPASPLEDAAVPEAVAVPEDAPEAVAVPEAIEVPEATDAPEDPAPPEEVLAPEVAADPVAPAALPPLAGAPDPADDFAPLEPHPAAPRAEARIPTSAREPCRATEAINPVAPACPRRDP